MIPCIWCASIVQCGRVVGSMNDALVRSALMMRWTWGLLPIPLAPGAQGGACRQLSHT